MTKNNTTEKNGLDWEHRLLCSDGNCIGIIGADGRCKECGKRYKGKLPEYFGVKPEDETKKINNGDLLETENIVDPQEEKIENKKEEIDADWENRILCSNENCIGVIGPDGICNECGRPYEKSKE